MAGVKHEFIGAMTEAATSSIEASAEKKTGE
jgi:hypothetical protein